MDFRALFILVVSFLLTSLEAYAQQKFFTTSNRGGAAGAKQNAQITGLQQKDEAMFDCTQAGMLYAPGHAQADGNGCLPVLTIDAGGDATFTNGLSVGGVATLSGATTINNSLDVTGTSTLGVLNATQINVNGNNFSSVPTCNASTQKLRWNGTGWECTAETAGGAGSGEIDPQVGGLQNGRLCRSDGSQVICDQTYPDNHAWLTPPNCGTGSKLNWTGSVWQCLADQGVTSESDPQVGTLNNGKWCTASGGQVVCTSDAPSGGGSSGPSCNPQTGSTCGCGCGTITCSGSCTSDCCGDAGDW